jgi:hypothetical protein
MSDYKLQLSDITIGEYIGWYAATNDIMKYEAITGLSHEEARNVPIDQMHSQFDAFEKAMNGKDAIFKNRFTLNGIDFGLIPDFKRTLSAGAYADLMHFTAPENINNEIAKAMCVLYRPVIAVVGDRYEIEQYDNAKHLKNEEAMKRLTMDTVNGVLLFFSIIAMDLQNCSQIFLAKQMMEVNKTIHQLNSSK